MKHAPGATGTPAAAPPVRGSSWTRAAQPTRGSSWTRDAQPARGSSWTRTAAKVSGIVTAFAVALVPAAGTALAATSAAEPTTAAYVVRVQPGAMSQVESAVRSTGGTVTRRMTALQTLTTQLSPAAAAALRGHAAVASVVGNVQVKLAASDYQPANDAGSLHNVRAQISATATATTGRGVDVALIDSGISPVPGLDLRRVVNGPDLSFESTNDDLRYRDTIGHGTHMAGIILGRDQGAALDGSTPSAFVGVAPGARLISLKVADARGASDVTQVLAAIDWVISHRQDEGLNIKVLNLSFGTDSKQSYEIDPLAHAVEVAWAQGITVVTSAGNTGSSLGRLTAPAVDPFVIAVGASDSQGTISAADDTVASFSARGDGVRNPDLLAPGRSIQSLRVPGSYVDAKHGESGKIGERFFRGSGTSQAAAVVSGAAALLLSQRPGLSPDQVKAALKQGARPLPGVDATAQGAGLLDLGRSAAINPGNAPQRFALSSGTGSIDGSRGSMRLSYQGKVLDGERDIHGKKYSAKRLAKERAKAESWDDGTWNETEWTGSSWAGSSWAGSSWAGSSWAGSSWAGSSWAGSSWATGTWTGSSWAGSSWAGSSWAGSSWAGSSWAGSSWAGSSWASSSWS